MISGVTTAMTCFESLKDAIRADGDPKTYSGMTEADTERLAVFASNAAVRADNWKSEGAARRYCIVRAVAPMIRLQPAGLDVAPLAAAVREVWEHVSIDPERRGIFEVSELEYRYPPNAFLTYWGIRSLRLIPELADEFQEALGIADSWLHGVVGREIGLHYDAVHGKDPQQLAWAIFGLLVGQDNAMADRQESDKELVAAGLRCFFEQQLPNGTWETGRPLFHYPEAGNAYCYMYETLAELLTLALDQQRPYAAELRRMLTPHIRDLLRAAEHLESTQRILGEAKEDLHGWSSGHHPHRTSPESWATATAYRFLQGLRRFVGWEARERALRDLKAQRVTARDSIFGRRGPTWDAMMGSAGDLIAALFVHPVLSEPDSKRTIDPDRPLLREEWARSAILFGPPGTGKTSFAKSVAAELNWNFIEITPADFLDRGTDFVSARADEIFRTLQEVDHAVVLFDEIDELIRHRSEATDMLERFFTTTMLPRLAHLWAAKKLIFFVNTNSISRVDPAIQRSQRFDAAIFVLPPSFEEKVRCLPTDAQAFIAKDTLYAVLRDYPTTGSEEEAKVAWLTFLRFDQLARLGGQQFGTPDDLRAELVRLGEEMFSDWALVDDCPADVVDAHEPDIRLRWMIEAYRSESRYQRIDASRVRIIKMNEVVLAADWLADCGIDGYMRWVDGSAIPDSVLDGAGGLA